MTNVLPKTRIRRQRSNCSIYQVHYALPKSAGEMARPFPFGGSPLRVQEYDRQVAGHRSRDDRKYIGLLQCNDGTILKPIIKEAQRREVMFYETLKTTAVPDLVELREFVPKYYGCRKYTYNGHESEYIILEDLVERMLEPCIMDLKIGKQTWDPLASDDKREKEQSKYGECKAEFGFCIPGFQVCKLPAAGRVARYGKDFGKRLKGDMVKDALRNYLNGQPYLCRALLLRLLAPLWRLQRLSAAPRRLRLYAASLLIVYDAGRVRRCCGGEGTKKCRPATNGLRRQSLPSLAAAQGASFSGQISDKGPIFKRLESVPITPMAYRQTLTPTTPKTDEIEKLNSHSFENNYEDKLTKIKMDYKAMLDQLSNEKEAENWATVKVIDFAHAFLNEDQEMGVDENFKEGIDSLVAIFEDFLKETDEQF